MKKSTLFIPLLLALLMSHVISAQTTIEAEDAQVIGQGILETEHTGYSGVGYINGDNVIGSYLEWAISMETAGIQTIEFIAANGSTTDRSMILNINGSDIETISFPGTGAWTTYLPTSKTITLQAGLNVIKMTANTTNGGPNMDKISITGNLGSSSFCKVNAKAIGYGSASISPIQEYYEEGSQITITSTANTGFAFAGWYEDRTNNSNTLNHTVEKDTTLTAMFIKDDLYIRTDEQIGWCDYDTPATGGKGGEIVFAATQSDLINYLSGSTPRIVQITGSIHLSPIGKKIDVGSNKTIVGLGGSGGPSNGTIIGGGLRPKNATNIIIKNLTFKDAYVSWDGKTTDNDAIEINNSTHVWITHCDFTHFDDGLCDIKNGSDFITVSWCHFYNHNKVMLIGSGDGETQDIGHLNVTLHHNWFDGRYNNGVGQRLPMCRFGKIHVYNNYYTTNSVRGVEGNYDSDVVVDNNYFDNIIMPHVLVGNAGNNKMNASGNIYANNTGTRRDKDGDAFTPTDYYSYSMLEAEDVPVVVMLGAGPIAPVEIGNSPTSVIDSKGNDTTLKCYPIPITNELNIQFTSQTKGLGLISIISLSGITYVQKDFSSTHMGKNHFKINVDNIPAGSYVVKIISNDGVLTEQIIIQ